MKPRKLRQVEPSAEGALSAALMAAIGSRDFAAQLLNAVASTLPASHCTVFALRSSGRVEAISSASAIGEVATLTAVEYMRMGFDKQDSNMVWLAKRKPGKAMQLWIGHQLAEEVANEEYRRLCYGETGIRERLSLLAVFPDGYRFAVSLYRNFSYAEFSEPDFDWIAERSALVSAAVMRHIQVAARPHADGPLEADLMTRLSGREREMISHVLAGMTTKEAAREMGISTTTALTYRYRAFQHLGIRSHRELMVLLGAGAPAPDRRRSE
ncbi:MAG TPA: LuxR C-terminal-related transcriptional regulator [Burkholderiaceae bacterium]|nr:LuxR C-terminal-related transcriptional regulator [Burkholderiaceae bacterium]